MALLSLLDVHLAFGGPPILDGVNLQIEEGERVCLVGRNGAGKTTLFRIATGAMKPDSGEVGRTARQALLTQEIPDSLPGSVRDIVASGLVPEDASEEDWERDLRVDDLVARLGLPEDRPFDALSGGLKRRCLLARALAAKPELLLLDEPTSAVDPESRRDFWEKLFDLADAGTTLLVSTHYMDEAERCHRLAILDRGRLVADGTPQALTEALAGRTLEVVAAQPRRAQQALVGLPGVLSVAQVGNSLRVLVAADGDARARIETALQQANLTAEVAVTPPNLEDVFTSATRAQAAERAA